jgi:hypothetical protein
MAKNAPLLKPRFLRMARLAQCLKTVIDKPARANCFPRDNVINVITQNNPPRQLARLTKGLFRQLPHSYGLPNGRFVFPIIGPFGLVDPGRGGVIDAKG